MNDLSGKRVLIIEDEAFIAAMAQDMLMEMGAVIVGPAATIERGLALACNENIDVALLDVNIRSERDDPVAAILISRDIPVVFATGYGQSAVQRSSQAPILEKPYTQDKLARALNHALHNHYRQKSIQLDN
jgi:DNA-binding NtrC family response regulator